MPGNNDIQPKYFFNVYFCGGPFLWRPLGTCPVCPVLNPALILTDDESSTIKSVVMKGTTKVDDERSGDSGYDTVSNKKQF